MFLFSLIFVLSTPLPGYSSPCCTETICQISPSQHISTWTLPLPSFLVPPLPGIYQLFDTDQLEDWNVVGMMVWWGNDEQHGLGQQITEKLGGPWQRATVCSGRTQSTLRMKMRMSRQCSKVVRSGTRVQSLDLGLHFWGTHQMSCWDESGRWIWVDFINCMWCCAGMTAKEISFFNLCLFTVRDLDQV